MKIMGQMRKNKPESVEKHEDEAFLSRWSKRKHAHRTISMGDEPHDKNPQELAAEEDELPTDEDMPAIETLTEDSDYTGFLSPNVSEELRSLALSKLFHSEAFNVCDGLDDYAEDFSSFAKLGNIITADMQHQLEVARNKLEQQMRANDAGTDQLPENHELSSAAYNLDEADQGTTDEDELVEDN